MAKPDYIRSENGVTYSVGDRVRFNYVTDKLHSGVIHEIEHNNTRVGIIVDEQYHSENGGAVRDGKKFNSIEIKKLKGIIMNPDTPSAPFPGSEDTSPVVEEEIEIKEGDRIVVRSKEDLVAELGADSAGYPQTITRFNHNGDMDHYFESTGTVRSIKRERGYVKIDFDNTEEGKEYGWHLSIDALVKDDGTYVPDALKEPLRTFMVGKTDPTPKQVWTALMTLKKKLSLKDGSVVNLFQFYTVNGIDGLRRVVEFTKEESFKHAITPVYFARAELYYPKINFEVLLLVFKNLSGARNDIFKELIDGLVAMKVNEALAIEYSDTLFTPIKRLLHSGSQTEIESVWSNLNIKDNAIDDIGHMSSSAITDYLHASIVEYLETNKKTHLDESDIIEIGA